MAKLATAIRLSPEAARLRDLLAEKLAVSKSGVIELALRLLAKSHKVG